MPTKREVFRYETAKAEYDIIMPITTGNYIGNNYIMSEKSNFSNEEDDSNSNTSPLNKEKLEDIIQDINLLPTTISTI